VLWLHESENDLSVTRRFQSKSITGVGGHLTSKGAAHLRPDAWQVS
jgi:hypothetical protein